MKSLGCIFLFLSLILSCKKENNCFISEGNKSSNIIYLDEFSNIEIHDFMDVNWHYSSEHKIEIKGGENFIDEISTEIVESYLRLENKNGCKLLRRNVSEIRITLFCPHIDTLTLKGNGKVVFVDTMKSNLWVNSYTNQGTMNLKISNDKTKFHLESGSNDINLEGSSNYCDYYNLGTNHFYAKNFEVDSFRCHNQSNGVTEIKVNTWLNVEQNGDGDIHYWGNPKVNIASHLGKGEIVNQY